ncbi:MAG: hypothetical protein AB7O97_15070 [Planctomycetota bacterium]
MADAVPDPRVRRLSEHALRGGSLTLALLLEQLVPVSELRRLAREFDVSPKGFRVDRAPAKALAPELADPADARRVEAAVSALVARVDDASPAARANVAGAKRSDGSGDLAAALRFQEQENARLRDELERARQGALRASERESTLRQMAERGSEQVQLLRGELERARRAAQAAGPADGGEGARDLAHRLHELEHEIEARANADEALRRQLAVERSRIRELEDEVAELEPLVPKGRRRKAAPAAPPAAPPRRFVLPYFLPSFYRSLEGKDRKSVERALQAVLLFCTEGHSYPGLEVKRMGGQDTWSLRASRGLRVYFHPRDDGDVEFLELADREEQNTTLRRLKER